MTNIDLLKNTPNTDNTCYPIIEYWDDKIHSDVYCSNCGVSWEIKHNKYPNYCFNCGKLIMKP